VPAPRPSRCATAEFDAVEFDALGQFACRAAAVYKGAGHATDPACQDKASAAFYSTFAKAAQRRDCGPAPADPPAIDRRVRRAASESAGTVKPPVTTCAPIEVTTLHGPNITGNARLAKIENGRVACMNSETAAVTSCVFETAAGRESGEWLESSQGSFAVVGQSLQLNGTPGGDYIIAAKVSDGAPAACVEPAGMDTMGLIPPGSELSAICTVEDVLADYNALSGTYPYFAPLRNFADREVCSNNDPAKNPHPDGAAPVRSYSSTGSGPDDVFCYKGWGASLNDPNGTEREDTYTYYVDARYCHYINNGGFEVPAAKRPGVISFPAPGRVNPKTSIVWRPVVPDIVIANGSSPAAVQLFMDESTFMTSTQATPATGPLPYLGQVANATIGSATFSIANGGNTLFVGVQFPGDPDWYPAMPGNDIGLGYETLQVQLAAPVYSLGFRFVEPNLTMPFDGGTPANSPYEIVLWNGSAEVGRVTFDAPDDVVGFVGVWSDRPFNRVTIVDTTGNPDNELFGEFFTGVVPRP